MKQVFMFILTLLIIQNSVFAQSRVNRDSLTLVLKTLSDEEKLKKLYGLAYENLRNKTYKTYSDLLQKEASRQKNSYYEGSALFLMAKYYYMKSGDSMRLIIKKAEPILLKDNRIEEVCRMRGWSIYNYTREGKREKVMPAINSLKELAEKFNYPEGLDIANQSLADYYLFSSLKDEALKLYEEIFLHMEETHAPLIKRINIIRQLLNKGIASNKRALFYLDKLNEYILDCKERGLNQIDQENPLYVIQYLYHRSYALLAIKMENPTLTLTHLTAAEQISVENGMESERNVLKQMRMAYYELTGMYDRAIKLNDEILAHFSQTNMPASMIYRLLKRAELLYKKGRWKESANAYQFLVYQKDSIRNAVFQENLATAKALYEVDKLEYKNKEMELEASKNQTRLIMMGSGIIFLLIICLFLFFIARFHRRYGLQLKTSKEKAEEADKLKSAFLANMNHEIRTPLNAIVGFSQVLVDEEDPEVRAELAKIIQSNNGLLQQLIADVLDISKIESNSMSFNYADHDLPSLMKDIYITIQMRMPSDVKLLLSECDAVIMKTDRNRLTQILTNLLTNAIKHTQAGVIQFGYELRASTIEFFVQDTGEGIPNDRLEQIFSRFVQLDSWHKGVGLGLPICKGLIEKMGGSIRVESKVGEGSVFYVQLPLKQ